MKLVNLNCDFCKKDFERNKSNHSKWKVENRKNYFCSRECNYNFLKKGVQVECKNCFKKFEKLPKEIIKSINHFCTRSCSASYNNTHKKYGTRRSKLEEWLENNLKELYPEMEMIFNNKEVINSELDIYIPSLNLAIELNGIFHYEPIYGKDKLDNIKNNDSRKFQACLEKNIELCIIDTSGLKYFKEQNCLKYLDIVKKIVESKMK